MSNPYDKYYKTGNLFGEPYSELMSFFEKQKAKGKLLDLGCGQGRNAIPLAKMCYDVVGFDNSKVGIDQLNEIAEKQNLPLQGIVTDIYEFKKFEDFDFILLDSMFHFAKKDKEKEIQFLKNIFQNSKTKSVIVICIQDSGTKVKTLKKLINESSEVRQIEEVKLKYKYVDQETNHTSISNYLMVVLEVS